MRLIAVALVALAAQTAAFHASTKPLSAHLRAQVQSSGNWHAGCPVGLADVRLLAVSYWGFDGETHTGRLVVNKRFAAPLARVFRRLYALRFAIHHMAFTDTYGARRGRPGDDDISASFECRQAAASPCTGKARTGSWSMHAYGEAIDLNPVENPYVGCGMTRDKTALSFLDRSRLRRGMVTPEVVAAFASIGWGWGGAWTGATKDYMHFSANGH
jgi:hypothetical protein